MTHIHDIPLDAWVIILRFINRNRLVDTFNSLFKANIFNIPEKCRIDTFWIVISQARYLEKQEEMVALPNGAIIHESFKRLIEMGVHPDCASDVLRRSKGDFQLAVFYLGWF